MTYIICECGHEIENHTYSDDYTGCDIKDCKCKRLVPEIATKHFQTRLTALEQAARKVATKDNGLVPDDFKVSYMIRAGDMRELAKLLNTEPK